MASSSSPPLQHRMLSGDTPWISAAASRKAGRHRVRIASQLLRPHLGQRLHHLRRRRIRVLVGIELDDVGRLGLKPRRIPRRPFYVVTKITHRFLQTIILAVIIRATGRKSMKYRFRCSCRMGPGDCRPGCPSVAEEV